MKKIILLYLSLIFLACSQEENNNALTPNTDIIIGRWEEVLNQGSLYEQITWTFSSSGEMQLEFEDDFTAFGEWSKVNSTANTYSFSFQQYPDAAKRTFFLVLTFSSNNTAVSITDDSSTFHWVGNRLLNKIPE